MTLAVLILAFLVFLALGVPVAWSLAAATLAVLASGLVPLPPAWYAHEIYRGADSISLASIPLFLFAGGLMNEGGLTRRIIDVADDCLGWMRGGLGLVNVATCMVYGGISGSSTADTGAEGSIMIPAMAERGYPKDFAAAVTAASGTLGIIIPPSVVMIMYGVITSTSIGGLFVAGILPGILVAVAFMVTAYIVGVREGFPRSANVFGWGRFFGNAARALPALLMPLIVLGSILTGLATVTEAAFVGVAWAFVAAVAIYRELTWSGLKKISLETLRISGSIMIIMAVATPFSWILTVENVPAMVADVIVGQAASPMVTIALILILLLFVGMWLDTGPALVILAPIIHPIGLQAGLTPLQLGLIFTIGLGIGLFTPPVGTNMYVVCNIARLSLGPVVRRLIPFWISSIICLFIVGYVPAVTEFLPKLFGY